MSSAPTGSLQVSQGYEVLAPRTGKAYPVLCDEWRYLKEKLAAVSTPPWILPAVSFLFLGASLSSFIAILLGGVAAGPSGRGLVVAWAVVATTALSGISCLFAAMRQHQVQGMQVRDVIRQMELIEKRFEQGTA